MKWTCLLLLSLLAFSCGQELSTSGRAKNSQFNAVTCSCSNNYAPVCGIANNQYVTFTNACVAQCNGVNYTDGACSNNSGSATANNGQPCNPNSGQICGQRPTICDPSPDTVCAQVMAQPMLYANECEMINAGASAVAPSDCN